MKMGSGGSIRRDLGRLFDGQSVVGLDEAQLLDRFVDRRDPSAFEALVALHGPMVLGVCRRLLADPLDVEDAFQATFLVFVRRAGSIRGRDRLAPWLFGVARNVAKRTRTDVARRKARESSGAEELAEARNSPDRELSQVLLEEIDRLPVSLREPILLCCVEGLSYEDAATRMQSTAPAVRGRLARGRERLRDRLTRRGFAPSVVGTGGLLAGGAVRAAVPASLLLKTTLPLKTAGAFPSGVIIIAEGVLHTMIATKTKFLAAALLACGVAGSGAGVYAQRQAKSDVTDANTETIERRLEARVNELPAPPTLAESDEPGEPKVLKRVVTPPPQILAPIIQFSTDGGKTWTEKPITSPTTTAVITRTANVVSEHVQEVEIPPPSQNPDADRLGQLEKKLDRVLEALERSDQPASRPTRATRSQPALPAPPAVPAPPVAALPPSARGTDVRAATRLDTRFAPVEGTEPADPSDQPRMGSREVAIDPFTGRPVGVTPGASHRDSPVPPNEGRIDALEQRIKRLEDQIKKLDQNVEGLLKDKVSRENPPGDVPASVRDIKLPPGKGTVTRLKVVEETTDLDIPAI